MTSILKNRLLLSASLSLALACPALTLAQAPVGDLVTPDATVRGAVQSVSTGTRVMSGSSISASGNTASVRLLRGGEIRVCPRTTLSLALSPSGRDLALSLGTGGIETHYRLRSSADTIMTPDFRILLAGPGTFDYAINSDARGNTCIRSLNANSASLVVSEIMGDGSYQVQGGDQVYFRGGSVASPTTAVPPDCGCPPPVATMNATAPQPSPAPAPVPAPTPSPASVPAPASQNQPAQPTQVPANSPEAVFAEHGRAVTTAQPASATSTEAPATAPAPKPPADSEVHIQVDAPFVFNGAAEAQNIPPAPQVAYLRLVYLPKLLAETQDTVVAPPTRPAEKPKKQKATKLEQPNQPSKGFFGHIKSFFGSIFK